MLNAVHKQLLAARLADMFAASPLMLVYQTLGTVRSSQISESLQSELEKRVPNSGVKATCFKIKNSVSVGVEDATLQGLLQANNILVGWQVPQDSILSQLHASRNTRLSELLAISAPSSSSTSSLQSAGQASTSAAAGARPSSIKAMRPHLPQSTMSVLIELSTKMPDKMPVALLASFYRGQQVRHSTRQGVFCAGMSCCCTSIMNGTLGCIQSCAWTKRPTINPHPDV